MYLDYLDSLGHLYLQREGLAIDTVKDYYFSTISCRPLTIIIPKLLVDYVLIKSP